MAKIIDRPYNTFESVEDLKSYMMILEEKEEKKAKKNKPKKKEEEEVSDPEEKEDIKDPEKEEGKTSDDKIDVIYSDQKQSAKCIFKHIIVFTNEKDPKENKTLKNILDAIKTIEKSSDAKEKPELHLFFADEVRFELDDADNMLTISDSDSEIDLTKDFDNTNTLIFSRLSVQGEDACEHVVELLQDRGFLVLNPIKYSAVACNKYDSAELFRKGEIPQPNFCLMTKEILYDEKQYLEAMRKVEPKFSGDGDKDEDLKFVVKILDGHGGTGVAMVNGKMILAIFQMIFAIDPERQLIVQRKEEGDGGDIRVHVLTLRTKQMILAAMKRIKIASDFRSNVSLGASAEPVTLTPEQEQIALKTAKLSKMPWCAVDIMPLVKGSNKELGDNVVLEINASPGTDGITDVIKTNFVNILMNELDDPKEFCLQNKTAGYIESVQLDFGKGKIDLLAKLDTGNGATASHVEVGEYTEKGDTITFTLGKQKYSLKKVGESKAITGDVTNVRPIVMVDELVLGQRKVKNIEMAIVKSRENKSTNVLLNREVLSYLGMVVNPNETHLLTQEMEKVKII